MASSSSPAPDAAESSSSRAGQEAAALQREYWVALVSAADVLGDTDSPRAQAIGDGRYVLLDDKAPPLPSRLVLHPRIAPDPRRNDEPLSAYILAAADRAACVLLQVVEGTLPDFFLCNTRTRTVTLLPPVPAAIQGRGHDIRQHRSVGLVADQEHPGHFVVAQLHPSTAVNEPNKLLYYSTAKGKWFIRGLYCQQAPMRNPFSETGVLAHDGRLWWVALAFGVFFCDPFTAPFETPQLRFLALPEDCEMAGDDVGFDPRVRTLLDQRRSVRPSEGKLRFVEIRGLSYDDDVPAANPTVRMWTLDDPEGQQPWTPEYEVAFAEIWDDKAYADEGLPREVPHVALVDPTNHFVVYFFQGSKLFGFDMSEKKLVACKECPIDRDHVLFRSSRPIIDAWVPPPPPPPKLPGDDDDSSSDEDAWWTLTYAKYKKLEKVTKSVDDWLNKARLEWTRDTDAWFENWRAWKMTPPPSDESSVYSGGQADDDLEIQLPLSP